MKSAPIRIVALDGHTLTFDGLSWEPFEQLGAFRSYDRSAPQEVLDRLKDVAAVIVNKCVLPADLLEKLPTLKYVGVTATGVNNVDLEACKRLGIAVTNVPAYSSASVAQLVFAYLLASMNQVVRYDELVHSGAWQRAKDFAVLDLPTGELQGRVLGIVGYGAIGRQVARIAQAFEMEVLIAGLPGRSYDISRMPFEEVLRKAEYLTFHCTLTKETEHIVNERTLSFMRKDAVIINTARGGLIDENALAAALREHKIRGAYIDVLSAEPPTDGNPLLAAPNVIITPHIGWATREARVRLMNESARNLAAFIDGEARNRLV